MASSPHLADRYGAPSPARRWLGLAVVGVLVAASLAWLAWTSWFHATPAVHSELVGYQVVDDHRARATVSVAVEDGVSASCVVRAVAADHMTVGEVAFEPVDGRNEVTLRTERRASAVTLTGCTAEGQPRPR
ncbi:MAG TPA: DUF4307 domain-containing protein [Nocardioides sp.]|nr:DUF4307 domain-containing protein [Nocardioides sp.]